MKKRLRCPSDFTCECCSKKVRDPYTKDWIHVDGHIAIAFGRDPNGRGISTSLDEEFYCCSFKCFTSIFCVRLSWKDPRKTTVRDGT